MFLCVILLAILAVDAGATKDPDQMRPNSVIVLLTSGANSNQVHESVFNLFNVSSEEKPIESAAITLVDPESFFRLSTKAGSEVDDTSKSEPKTSLDDEQASTGSRAREARKMSLFNGLWNKPKISPLYLINGTVCRFVNAAPICTTLSTQGLLRK